MSDLAPPSAIDPRARTVDRRIGLLIVAVTFALSLALSLWAKNASRPETSAPPGPPRTDGIAGWPGAVDPVKTLAVARSLTQRNQFRGMIAEGVRSDGTVDLSEGPGQVRYAFQSAQGEGPRPLNEPGTLPHREYCGRQNVQLRHEGLVADPDLPEFPCPPAVTDALPEPHCDLRAIWNHAVSRGAPREQLAKIEYYRAQAGPAWRFELPGTPHRFSLYGDCGRELNETEAAGFVP
jgi:hypothetical protein